MAEFVRFTLDDGSEVLFESAESDLVALHGGAPELRDGGKLTARLQEVAGACHRGAGRAELPGRRDGRGPVLHRPGHDGPGR